MRNLPLLFYQLSPPRYLRHSKSLLFRQTYSRGWPHGCGNAERGWGYQQIQETKKPESGEGGMNIQNASISTVTYGFKDLPQIVEQSSSEPLLPLYEDDSFQDLTKMIWCQQQCKRPLQNWVRFLGQMWGTTLHMSQDLTLCTQPWQDNSKAWGIQTQEKNSRKPYLFVLTEKFAEWLTWINQIVQT